PAGRLPERGDQLFQLCDPIVLALIARFRGNEHRLEGGNIVGKFCAIELDRNLPDQAPHSRKKTCPETSCRSHSTASGARASTARTRRQSSPENRASNCAWLSVISPSLTIGQVKLCSSSRL